MQDRTSATSAKSSCNARPDHTFGSIATDEVEVTRSRMSASPLKADNLHTISASPLSATTGLVHCNLLQRKPSGFTVSSFREFVPIHDAGEEAHVAIMNLAGQRVLGSSVSEYLFAEVSEFPDQFITEP